MSSVEEQTGVTNIPKHIDGLAFSENGRLAVVASNLTGRTWDGVLAIFSDAKFAPNIPHMDYAALNEAGCTDVTWIDENRVLLSTDAGTVEVWTLKEAPLIENTIMLAEHDDICTSISLSQQSKQILSGSWDGTVKLWDLEVDLPIHNIRIHTDKVLDVAWNQSTADIFATASEDSTVKIYDNREASKPASILHSSQCNFPTCVDWVDENKLFVGFSHGQLVLLDTRNPGENIASSTSHKKSVNKVLSCGNTLASGADDLTVQLHSVKDLSVISCDKRHTDYVMGLAYSRKDNSVWSSAWDGNILSHVLEKNINTEAKSI